MWHIDVIKTPPRTVDIRLIWDEANQLAPYRGPCPKVQPLSENLATMVEHAKAANLATSEPTDTTLVESILGASTTSSSSRSTSSSTMVPHVRVQKLEAQMATLLHHIKPWMQRSISEAEEWLERKMAQHTKQQNMEVHQHLIAFDLRVSPGQPL